MGGREPAGRTLGGGEKQKQQQGQEVVTQQYREEEEHGGGTEEGACIRAQMFQLFDPVISPRNVVLLGLKDMQP